MIPRNVQDAPWRGGPARKLPHGATRSAWPDLDPTSRQVLVQDYLATYPQLVPTGSIDYEADREPLFLDQVDGNLVSIAGFVFPAGEGQTLAVTMRKPAEADNWPWALLAFLGILAGVVVLR